MENGEVLKVDPTRFGRDQLAKAIKSRTNVLIPIRDRQYIIRPVEDFTYLLFGRNDLWTVLKVETDALHTYFDQNFGVNLVQLYALFEDMYNPFNNKVEPTKIGENWSYHQASTEVGCTWVSIKPLD